MVEARNVLEGCYSVPGNITINNPTLLLQRYLLKDISDGDLDLARQYSASQLFNGNSEVFIAGLSALHEVLESEISRRHSQKQFDAAVGASAESSRQSHNALVVVILVGALQVVATLCQPFLSPSNGWYNSVGIILAFLLFSGLILYFGNKFFK